ncbi:glutamine amidotransferase [Candidatus Saccharibacteria bacterium]|nr:glutamine amidotransferase [Candidatus Saccharibacteria bacterium]
MKLNVLHLYPKEMNLYGDHGNVLAFKRRCEWRGIDVNVIEHEPGDKIPNNIDFIFGGGGQDSGQGKIEEDLQLIAPQLKKFIENDVPCLVICGLYQLFGKYFQTSEGQKIIGTSIINVTTKAGPERLIGNIVINSYGFGEIVGYENHSGLTSLGSGTKPFGEVITGAGNNGEDKTEGCRYKNCICTYLHGPLLPKNPKLTDFFISKAIEHKTGEAVELKELDDSIEQKAHAVAVTRPR